MYVAYVSGIYFYKNCWLNPVNIYSDKSALHALGVVSLLCPTAGRITSVAASMLNEILYFVDKLFAIKSPLREWMVLLV